MGDAGKSGVTGLPERWQIAPVGSVGLDQNRIASRRRRTIKVRVVFATVAGLWYLIKLNLLIFGLPSERIWIGVRRIKEWRPGFNLMFLIVRSCDRGHITLIVV